MRLEKTLLWSQDEQILDAAVVGDTALVLSPSRLTWLARRNGQWTAGSSMELPVPKTWPRDLRGQHSHRTPGRFRFPCPEWPAGVPVEGPSIVECHSGDEPWVLDSGSQAMLLANLASGRNYFDGRIAAQNGSAQDGRTVLQRRGGGRPG